jgi:hypothetical protein
MGIAALIALIFFMPYLTGVFAGSVSKKTRILLRGPRADPVRSHGDAPILRVGDRLLRPVEDEAPARPSA